MPLKSSPECVQCVTRNQGGGGGGLNIKMFSYQYRVPMLKIRRSRDHLIFNMGITILGKDGPYFETGPRNRIAFCIALPIHLSRKKQISFLYLFPLSVFFTENSRNCHINQTWVAHPNPFNIVVNTLKVYTLDANALNMYHDICERILHTYLYRHMYIHMLHVIDHDIQSSNIACIIYFR